jgi:hypothetical protein
MGATDADLPKVIGVGEFIRKLEASAFWSIRDPQDGTGQLELRVVEGGRPAIYRSKSLGELPSGDVEFLRKHINRNRK